MTQAELAENVGISVTYISSIERGLSFPRGEVLVGILYWKLLSCLLVKDKKIAY